MNLNFPAELESYRKEVRKWLEKNIPEWWHNFETRKQNRERYENMMTSWDQKLADNGFTGISWPKEYGGQGESILKEIIFEEEAGKLDAPKGRAYLGKILLGPTLLKYGTQEQKETFIPRLINNEDIWCQGFSEPNAGSDLAAINTRAVLEGDEWVINGQKVWTSEAVQSNWIFVLARTDLEAPKHKGITYFLVPMDSDGLSLRPLQKINGEAEFNEVFFDDVRIPKDAHVGNVNEGWKVAMTTLSYERGILALGRQTRFETEFLRAIKLASTHRLTESKLEDNDYYKQKIAQAYVDLRIMRYHGLNIISQYINNDGVLGPEASLQKLYWAEMRKRLGQLYLELQGEDVYLSQSSSLSGDYFTDIYYTALGETIYAGTSQIQRNIIAEKVLGLPR